MNPRIRVAVELAVIALLAAALYGPFFDNPRVFDDRVVFSHQQFFERLSTRPFGIDLRVPAHFTLAFTEVMWGRMEAHRLIGLALHIACGFLLYRLLARLVGTPSRLPGGDRGGRPLLDKYGKYIHLNERRLQRMERWFERRGRSAIVLGRLIPGLRIPTTIMAGLADVPYRVYAPTNALAAIIWSVVYFLLGALFQREWALISSVISGLLENVSGSIFWIWVLIALLGVGGGTWHARRRMRHDFRLNMHALLHLKKAPSLDPPRRVDSASR